MFESIEREVRSLQTEVFDLMIKLYVSESGIEEIEERLSQVQIILEQVKMRVRVIQEKITKS